MSDFEDDKFRIHPDAQKELDAILKQYPDAKNSFTETFALIRQAHAAWQNGQYKSFEEAAQALGVQIKRIEEPDNDEDEPPEAA